MPQVRLTSHCQITIPKEICEREHLKPGDKLDFYYAPDGTLCVRAVNLAVEDVAGCLQRPQGKKCSDLKISEGIGKMMRRKHGK